jgi:hypothetical protein
MTTPNADVAHVFCQPSSSTFTTYPYDIRNGFGSRIRNVVLLHRGRSEFCHIAIDKSVVIEAQVVVNAPGC